MRYVLAAVALAFLFACGKTMTAAEKTDVSKAMAVGMASSTAGSRALQEAANIFQRVKRPGGRVDLVDLFCSSSAPAGCSASCNTLKTVWTLTCTGLSKSYVCGASTYKLESGSIKVDLDLVKFLTGTYSLTSTFGGTLSGGTLSGGTLACTVATSIDATKVADASKKYDHTVDCSGFSCTYGGASMACADMQATLGAGGVCS